MAEGPALLVESLSESIAALTPLGRELELQAGDVLWRPGEPGDEIVLVLEGRLELACEGAAGESVPLRHLYPGALAAESPDEAERRLTAVRAHVPSRVLLLPSSRFRELLRERTELLERLFWLQLRRVRALPWRPLPAGEVIEPLTGLYHHGFFRERLALEIERAQLAGDTVVLALFVVDHFHAYREAHGREAGARALETLAVLLRKTGRRADVASRLGSEEFATLLYGATASDGWRFAEAFRGAAMATGLPGDPAQPPRRLTVSAAVASYPADAQDETALIAAARGRLASARQAGGNCTVGVAGGSR